MSNPSTVPSRLVILMAIASQANAQRHHYRHEAHPVVVPPAVRGLLDQGVVGRLSDDGMFVFPGSGAIGVTPFSAWSPATGHVDLTPALPTSAHSWRVMDVGRTGMVPLVVAYPSGTWWRYEVGMLDTRTRTYAATNYVVQTFGGYVYGSINAANELLLIDSLLPTFQAAAIVRNGVASPLPLPSGFFCNAFALDDLGRAWGVLTNQRYGTGNVGTLTSPPTFVGSPLAWNGGFEVNGAGDIKIGAAVFDRHLNALPWLPHNSAWFADDRSAIGNGTWQGGAAGFTAFVWHDSRIEVDAVFDEPRVELFPPGGWRARNGTSAWVLASSARWAGTTVDGIALMRTTQRTLALQFPNAELGPVQGSRRIRSFPMRFEIFGGDAGQPVAVFVQAGGQVFAPPLAVGTFDADGKATFTFPGLPVYPGLAVDFAAYTIDPNLRLIASPRRRVVFG